LLVDLFRPHEYADLRAVYRTKRADKLLWTHAGFNFATEKLWADAEELSAYVDAATGPTVDPDKGQY
jgi:hypothetical protein